MNVAVLSIGDELLYGEIVDSNAAHIGERLYRLGVKVQRHLTVGDREGDIIQAIQFLSETSDTVIVTGGLGPTDDDITAAAAAHAAGSPLVRNEEALTHARRVGGKWGEAVHPRNDRQAQLPQGATLIPNPVGTASGFELDCHGCSFFFLPGVPTEMERMLEETVIPLLTERCRRHGVLATKVLKIFGLSEAEVEARVAGLIAADSGVALAYAVQFPEIHLKLRGEGQEARKLAEAIATAADAVRQQLDPFVFGEDGETIDSVVAAEFRRTGLTLALAESCTGGLVAKRITDLPGSSDYFLEGAVTYSDAAKIRSLCLPRSILEKHGAVSAETAKAMAAGIRSNTGSDLALAITGIAGPGGGTEEKPVGTVFLALAGPADCTAKGYRFSGSREEIRTITAYMALDWLRRYLGSL